MKTTFDNGTYGLLEFSTTEANELHIEVVPYRSTDADTETDTPYVALSHVWAEGLGNPIANALPLCQLNYVYKWVEQLRLEPGIQQGKLLVWLDTLCCTVSSPKHRNMCLQQMQQIYREAKAVLILDAQLAYFFRPGARFRRDLCPAAVLDLDAAALDFAGRGTGSATLGPIGRSSGIASCIISLRLCLSDDDKNNGQREPSLVDVHMAFRNRSVSVPSDEALCLCTCLAIDQTIVVQASNDERLAAFWSAMRHAGRTVPNSLLFFNGPRHAQEGLRWAPISFLGSTSSWSGLRKAKFTDEVAHISPKGLLVYLPAIEISISQVLSIAEERAWAKIMPDLVNVFFARETVSGEWFMLMVNRPESACSGATVQDILRETGGSAVVLQDIGVDEMRDSNGANDVAKGLIGSLSDHTSSSAAYQSTAEGQLTTLPFSLKTNVFVHKLKNDLPSKLDFLLPYADRINETAASVSFETEADISLPQSQYLSRLPIEQARGIVKVARQACSIETAPQTKEQHQEDRIRELSELLLFFHAGRVGEVRRTWSRAQRWCVD
ncbi:hypothetical protein KC351_g6005 [Hortaea werneckii]|nr:hypothetical protein KC351_g6005 [Hortaea werneckii]